MTQKIFNKIFNTSYLLKKLKYERIFPFSNVFFNLVFILINIEELRKTLKSLSK